MAVGGVEAGVVVGQESVGEQIKNCADELRPVLLRVAHGATDMFDCSNVLLVAWLAHTHKS